MKPSVGRIVHYHPPGDVCDTAPVAAIITRVADPRGVAGSAATDEVALTIFPAPWETGEGSTALQVRAVPFADPPRPHSWRWPPRT